MSKFELKEGETYICTKSGMPCWWTEGTEYHVVLNTDNESVILDDQGDEWYTTDFTATYSHFELKDTPPKLTPKEGQTYVCKRDKLGWWTLGKEYTVQKFSDGGLYITANDGLNWYLPNDELLNQVFKLKEKTVDLNTLTTAQLKEYVGLLENKENADRSLNEFIERITKECTQTN